MRQPPARGLAFSARTGSAQSLSEDRPPVLTREEVRLARQLVVYEDEVMLVFAKPAGLAVQTRNPDDLTLDKLIWAFARSNGKRPKLVHRLDRDTSGLIIAAKTQPAAAALSAAFAGRTMHKTYLALVAGLVPEADEGTIEAALYRTTPRPGLEVMRVATPGTPKSQDARTGVRILARTPIPSGGTLALVEARPETGRMHQIRVHLAHIGCPILGDRQYGGVSRMGPAEVERIMLHALALEGPHPVSGRLEHRLAPPQDFFEMAARFSLEGPLSA
jgi:tRNA pseudouridine32 synthase/23S rRNA pseudouridine746 synthase